MANALHWATYRGSYRVAEGSADVHGGSPPSGRRRGSAFFRYGFAWSTVSTAFQPPRAPPISSFPLATNRPRWATPPVGPSSSPPTPGGLLYLLRRRSLSSAVTIVLPVHNVERNLARVLARVLEVAYSLGQRLEVAIVDDGSIDGTYEAACELARRYPQVRVLRQPFQRGLRAALELVRRELGVERVVAHDGVNAVNAEELCQVLRDSSHTVPRPTLLGLSPVGEGRRSRRSATLTAVQHEPRSSAGAFHWLRLDDTDVPRRKRTLLAPVVGASEALSANFCATTPAMSF